MKIFPKQQTSERTNGFASITDYTVDDLQINFVIATISGRYPDKGQVLNTKCKLLAYVQEGNGKLCVENTEVNLNPGDVVLIDVNEKYHWDGKLKLHISCSPAWSPEQHEYVI